MSAVKLVEEFGRLCVPNAALHEQHVRDWFKDENPVLIYHYPAGDVDTIPWPIESEFSSREQLLEHLQVALLDCIETGTLPVDTAAVLLPDGSTFDMHTAQVTP